MAKVVTLRCRISTGAPGIWFEVGLSGRAVTVGVDGFDVTISIPEWTGEVGAETSFRGSASGSQAVVCVAFLDITVQLTVGDDWSVDPYAAVRQAFMAALRGGTRLLDTCRGRQPWTALAGSRPPVVSMEATDGEETRELDAQVLTANTFWNPYSLVDEQTFARGVSEEAEAFDVLLAQARYFAEYAPDPQPGLAVLLAAVACEARAKAVLLDHALPDARPLLDVLLRKPRTFDQPAAELFGFTASAVLGRSLRDDNKDLFGLLTRLFQVRNGIAHRADSPSHEEGVNLVRAAVDAFGWLDEVGPASS